MFPWLLFLVFFVWLTNLSAMPLDPIEKFISSQVQAATTGNNIRVTIQLGQLDSRLKLRPCTELTPFVPPGTRLWGRAHVGVRCNEKPAWVVFLPVEIRVFATVPVAQKLLAAGQGVEPEDILSEEREVTRLGADSVFSLDQVRGRVLLRGLAPGQALVLSAFRSRSVVNSGDPVKIIAQGAGFSIRTDGTALAQAEAGQNVRVKLDNGRILQGVAQPGPRVEIKL
jgi:flagella basal body P-ring formation protein FlgA